MSSFPLLHLPHIPLQKVINCWELFESFEFSKVTEICKEVVRHLFKTSPDSVELEYGDKQFIKILYGCQNVYYVVCTQEEETYSRDPPCYVLSQKMEKFSFSGTNPSIDILKVMDLTLEISKNPISSISLNAEKLSMEQVEYFISWMNSIKNQSVSKFKLQVSCGKGEAVKIFLDKIKKPIEDVLIKGRYNEYLIIEGKVGPTGFECEFIEIDYIDWFQNEELFTLDFVKAKFDNYVNNLDVNGFLKNWKENYSNSKMEACKFKVDLNFCLKKALDGLSATIESAKEHTLEDKELEYNLQDEFESYSNPTKGNAEIKRDDGSVAIITLGKNNGESSLSIVVCKP